MNETQIRRALSQEIYGKVYEQLHPALQAYEQARSKAYELKVEGKTYDADETLRQAAFTLEQAVGKLLSEATKLYRRDDGKH